MTYYTVNMADCSSPFKRSVITTYHHSLSTVYIGVSRGGVLGAEAPRTRGPEKKKKRRKKERKGKKKRKGEREGKKESQ